MVTYIKCELDTTFRPNPLTAHEIAGSDVDEMRQNMDILGAISFSDKYGEWVEDIRCCMKRLQLNHLFQLIILGDGLVASSCG